MIRPILGQPQPPLMPPNAVPLMAPVLQPIPPPPMPASNVGMRMPPNIIPQQPPPSTVQPPPPIRNEAPIIDPRFQRAPTNIPTQQQNMGPRPGMPTGPPPSSAQQQPPPPLPERQQPPNGGANQTATGSLPSSSALSNVDQEKAALIMQVLQLTDEQIAKLLPEQRQSILLLKEQITQSAGGLI